MTLEEWVKVAAPSIQAIAIVVTAIIASKQLSAWRRQQLGKRKIEVAEEVLVAVYKARVNLSAVRDPVRWGGEGSSRQKEEGEGMDTAPSRDGDFVPLERLGKLKDDFAHFEKTKVLAQVYFGDQVLEPLQGIIRAYNEVTFAARILFSPGSEALGTSLVAHYRKTILQRLDGKDEIKDAVDSAVSNVESICRPHLK